MTIYIKTMTISENFTFFYLVTYDVTAYINSGDEPSFDKGVPLIMSIRLQEMYC